MFYVIMSWSRNMKPDGRWIRDELVEHGRRLFNAPKQLVRFTGDGAADALLNDLVNYPHSFVLACVMDRQIKAERAWFIPYHFKEKLGAFSIERLSSLSLNDVKRLMSHPQPLHRFADKMSYLFHAATHRIVDQYGGNATLIWQGKPSSAEVVYRFLEFEGVGLKIANMAANILARDFKIQFENYYSIDISADVHVRRVFGRLGLTSPDATVEQVIFMARSPEFPGLLDLPSWEIGRNWCKPKPQEPRCQECYMHQGCPSAQSRLQLHDESKSSR
jgi:endonuclease III